MLDVRYAMRYNELNERFYDHIDLILGVVTLVGGSGALIALAQGSTASTWLGAGTAAISILSRLLGAGRKAERHCNAKRLLSDLDAKLQSMTLEEIDSRLRPLQASAPSGIASLSRVAYYSNLEMNNFKTSYTPSFGERLAKLVA